MPIQIDRLDTAVEILAPTPETAGERRAATPSAAAVQSALGEMIGTLLTDELERFLRNRGM